MSSRSNRSPGNDCTRIIHYVSLSMGDRPFGLYRDSSLAPATRQVTHARCIAISSDETPQAPTAPILSAPIVLRDDKSARRLSCGTPVGRSRLWRHFAKHWRTSSTANLIELPGCQSRSPKRQSGPMHSNHTRLVRFECPGKSIGHQQGPMDCSRTIVT